MFARSPTPPAVPNVTDLSALMDTLGKLTVEDIDKRLGELRGQIAMLEAIRSIAKAREDTAK